MAKGEVKFDYDFSLKGEESYSFCDALYKDIHTDDEKTTYTRYCLIHKVFCCADCDDAHHSECKTISKNKLLQKLKESKQKFIIEINDIEKKITTVQEEAKKVSDKIADRKRELKVYCESILEEAKILMKEQMETQAKKCSEDTEKIAENNEIMANNIEKCKKASSDIDPIAENIKNLQKIIEDYESLKKVYKKFYADNDKADYVDDVNECKNKYSNMPSYKDSDVISKINVSIKSIEESVIETGTTQSDSEYLYRDPALSSYVTFFNIQTKTCAIRNLKNGEDPFNIPYGAGSVMYDNRIIIAGGTTNLLEYLKTCHDYSILLDRLSKRFDMIEPRTEFPIVEANGCVFAIGGKNNTGHLNTCEFMYLVRKEGEEQYKWKQFAKLNKKKAGVSACIIGEYLYAIGGIYEESADGESHKAISNTFERINPFAVGSSWDEPKIIKNLNFHSFSCAGMRVPGGKEEDVMIFIFGGINEEQKNIIKIYSLDMKYSKENKEIKEIDVGGLDENEGFEFIAPKKEKATKRIWVMGKGNLHYLNLKNFNKPEWVSAPEWVRLEA